MGSSSFGVPHFSVSDPPWDRPFFFSWAPRIVFFVLCCLLFKLSNIDIMSILCEDLKIARLKIV